MKKKKTTKQATIGLRNGCLQIFSGLHLNLVLNPGLQSDLYLQLPFAYDPSAQCPTFMKFLNRVLPDESSQAVLAEFIGYYMLPELRCQKSLVLRSRARERIIYAL